MTDFLLRPVYYPGTHLRRRSLSRLAFLFGRLLVLRPPGLAPAQPKGGGGVIDEGVVETAGLNLSADQARLLERSLGDYLRWVAEHRGASYALYVEERLRPRRESLAEVKTRLRGGSAEPLSPAPDDLSWQLLLRLAHDYDREQEEIEAMLERVRDQERELAGLTGLSLDEAESGEPGFGHLGEGLPGGPPEEMVPGARLAAYATLWLATGAAGTPLTESAAAHEFVIEQAGATRLQAGSELTGPVEYELMLPDAAGMDLAGALRERHELAGPLEGVVARLSALQNLLVARDWTQETRASVDLLFLELGEAAARCCRLTDRPEARLRLRCAVVPGLDPQRLWGRLSGRPPASEPPPAAGGLYLLAEEVR